MSDKSDAMKVQVINAVVQAFFGIGNWVAIFLSWHLNKSVMWAIFHAVCGWAYVVYAILFRSEYGVALLTHFK
jgi:hypothetical protein